MIKAVTEMERVLIGVLSNEGFSKGGIFTEEKEYEKTYGLTEDELFNIQILLRLALSIKEEYVVADINGVSWKWNGFN